MIIPILYTFRFSFSSHFVFWDIEDGSFSGHDENQPQVYGGYGF